MPDSCLSDSAWLHSVALIVLLGNLSRAQWATESYACLQNHSFCPPFSFLFIIKLLINYSLDCNAVKYSSSNFEFMPERLLACSICPASNCCHCPNLQLAIDVVWESPDGATFPWEHNTGTAGVTETFGLFPQAERAISAVWEPSVGLVPACGALQLCNTVLLQYAIEITLAVGCFFFFLGSWALLRESADLSCMENLLEILEILWLFQLSALLKNLCCMSKLKESFFFSTHW